MKSEWQQIHIYYQLNLKKINEQAEQKPTHRYREHFRFCQMGERLGDWVKR